MPGTDYQGTAAHIGRSLLSFRRDQVHAMEGGPHDTDAELEAFQKQVADRFNDLSSVSADELLSLSWIRKLIDVFLSCQEDFRIILLHNKSHLVKSPMDRLIADFYERSVKALDVCNAIRDGIEQIRQWQRLLEIVLCALDANGGHKTIGEGQFRRSKKALVDLTIGMLDDKDSGSAISHRNRSFGRNNSGQSSKENHNRQLGHFRSLSWSVSRSWSAAKQLQAIGANLTAPRGNEITTTNGLAVPVYTMGNVLLFAMWVLVAAIPCQDRGLHTHLNVPRQFPWAAPMLSLHDRIMEESKKRDRKNACGLLKEIYQIEKCSRVLSELADSVQFPLTEEKEAEVRHRVNDVALVFDAIKEDLDPLEKQVREAFHRIVRSRTEGLDTSGCGGSGD